MVAQFNASHPKIHVTAQFYGNSDYALQKVLTAIAGGKPPDISYLYGSWAANIAQSPKTLVAERLHQGRPVVQLERLLAVRAPGGDGERQDRRHPGAGRQPRPGLQQDALPARPASPSRRRTGRGRTCETPPPKLTDPAKKQFGWAYVNDASEDTVWRFEALLWQAGGEILTPDGKHAAFDSPAGVQALTLLQQMAVQDHSVYLDSGNDLYANLFNSGHIGMLFTGPWDLSAVPERRTTACRSCPATRTTRRSPARTTGCCSTTAPTASQGRLDLHLLVHEPQAEPGVVDADRRPADPQLGDTKLPGYAQYIAKYPGDATFVQNLQNAIQVRPVTPLYPKISTAIGQAVQAVLLGKAQPQQALDQAAGAGEPISGPLRRLTARMRFLRSDHVTGWLLRRCRPRSCWCCSGWCRSAGRRCSRSSTTTCSSAPHWVGVGQLQGAAPRPGVPQVDPQHDRVHGAVRARSRSALRWPSRSR